MTEFYVDDLLSELDIHIDNFPWTNRESYGNLLAQIYHWVSKSTRMLAFCASRLGVEAESMHQRFLAHAVEEKGHHLLALHDLKALGYEVSEFPELTTTAAFYQSQFYKIEYEHPLSMIGYIIALEGFSVRRGQQIYEIVHERFGSAASTFIQVHTVDDLDHLPKILKLVAGLPDMEQRMIRTNLRQSIELFTLMLGEIVKKSPATRISPED